MKKLLEIFRFIVLLLITAPFTTNGQQLSGFFPTAEKLQVFCDRSLYIAGENVFFSAFVINDQQQQLPDKVIYAEIISSQVEQLTGSKFKIKDHKVSGSLVIPKDAITGIYYLRVYTKYMRNLGPSSYSYLCLKIINPYRNEVMMGEDTGTLTENINDSATRLDLFRIDLNRLEFKPGETVEVEVNAINPLANDLDGMCVSVVPKLSLCNHKINITENEKIVDKIDFYPETRGLSITGNLKDINSKKPLSFTRVNLSIIGEGRDFMAILTDSAGRFFFSLPDYYGDRDLFLCAENTGDKKTEVRVDNDFCAIPFKLPSPVFKLGDEERNLAHKMALNERVREIFGPGTSFVENDKQIDNSAFYGQPTGVLYIDKYVELPTMEEYFNELPTQVKVRKKQGKKYFKVLGSQAAMLIYDPLVLVDWVAIDNPEKVLAISPKNVSRIEVVNEPYIKGNIIYGGIVHIISKQGDFAGIDLPQTGIFIDYLFLNDLDNIVISKPELSDRPDTRNTLYWNPDFHQNNKATGFSFTTPTTPGQYEVVLKGVKSNGDCYTQTAVFKVD